MILVSDILLVRARFFVIFMPNRQKVGVHIVLSFLGTLILWVLFYTFDYLFISTFYDLVPIWSAPLFLCDFYSRISCGRTGSGA